MLNNHALHVNCACQCFDYMVAGVEGIVGGRSHHPLRERLYWLMNVFQQCLYATSVIFPIL